MKTYYKWVDTAKGIGMILVVLGHALADTMLTGSENGVAQFLFNFIYSFHMPLFFFLSGFCSAKAIEMREWRQKGQYISLRFKRLMVPYFFIGLLYVPLKVILSGEVNTQVNLRRLPLDFITGDNPNFQLWTLYALFISTTLVCVLAKVGEKAQFCIAILICLASTVFVCPIHIVEQVCFEFFFFVCGVLYRKVYRDNKLGNVIIVLSVISFLGGNIGNAFLPWTGIKIITGFTGIILVCELCKRLKDKNTQVFDVIGRYSMDIYIMANLVQVMVRTVFLHKIQLQPVVCCFISTVLGIVLPILVSKYIVRKMRITRALILGDFRR